MRSQLSRFIIRYAVAAMSAAAAFFLALTLQHPWVTLTPFFLFYGAVAVSSWFGGIGPGLFATAIGAVAADYYLLAPHGSLRVQHPEDLARLVLFTLVGMLIASLNGALQRSQHRCEVEAMAARKSEARAKRLAEANLIGVFFSDLDGNIRWANQEFLRLLGKTPEELSSGHVNWLDVTAPEHRDRDENAIRELKECRICTPFEKDHLLRDGYRIPVLCGCAIVSEIDDVVGFVLDLTERRKAEAEAKANQERLRAMGAELMMAEEHERRRVASVLHDSVVVQMLALAKLRVDSVRRTSDADAKARLTEVYETIDQAITQTRTLTAEISPPVLYELGLAAAIQWLGDRMRSEYGISFQLDGEKRRQPLSDEVRTMLFQAVRELMVNVVKHARASKCRVAVSRDDDHEIEILVEDNGTGFQMPASHDYTKGGFGLFNIRQRLAHLGGNMRVESRPGGGSRITITAPPVLAAKGSER
jgi:PAS domain S-box-containing protein